MLVFVSSSTRPAENALKYNRMAKLLDLLWVFISDEMQNNIHQMELAYLKKDWDDVTNLAHKIKSAAASLGLTRMRLASNYLELYDKTKHSNFIDKLYYQFLAVNVDTVKTIKDWLKIYG